MPTPGNTPNEPGHRVRRVRNVLAFGALVAAVLAFAILAGAGERSTPVCTSGSSSIDAQGNAVTHWYPEGCKH